MFALIFTILITQTIYADSVEQYVAKAYEAKRLRTKQFIPKAAWPTWKELTPEAKQAEINEMLARTPEAEQAKNLYYQNHQKQHKKNMQKNNKEKNGRLS